ncbi:MAG: hypothetical protein ACFFAH_11315 [Promethearchaeota archaeon]
MVDEDKSKKVNVKDWTILSTTMIGALLTILALIWQFKPTNGIITVTFLLMMAFILFINAVTANSRAHYESKFKEISEKKIKRFINFAEYTFGLGFTFVIIGFAILGYKYLLDFTNRNVIALALPVTILLLAWLMMAIYNIISYSGKGFKVVRNLKRNIWSLIELGCMVLIILDYYQVFLIP